MAKSGSESNVGAALFWIVVVIGGYIWIFGGADNKTNSSTPIPASALQAAPKPTVKNTTPTYSLPEESEPEPESATSTSDSCDPNYSGCVPIASDVDCSGGSGNGPEYISGPVTVTGNDIYGLDRDGDGVGCE